MDEKKQNRKKFLRTLFYILFGILSAILICSLIGFLGLKLLIRRINEQPDINNDAELRTKIASTLYSQYKSPNPSIPLHPITKQIGPILNSDRGEVYSIEITLLDVQYSLNDGIMSPDKDNIFIFVQISIHNLGPNAIRSIGPYEFSILDTNGVLHENEFIFDDSENCDLESVDIVMGGVHKGCMKFNVPLNGDLFLIFAPYKNRNLDEGRYLSFPIRNAQN